MPSSVAEELAALRKQSLAKTHANKLKDANGLSTPEQEAEQIRTLNEQRRVGNYGKDAKLTLQSGGTKGGTVLDKTTEFQRRSMAMKQADKEKQKQAVQHLQSFNKAKSKIQVGPSFASPPPKHQQQQSSSNGGGGGGAGKAVIAPPDVKASTVTTTVQKATASESAAATFRTTAATATLTAAAEKPVQVDTTTTTTKTEEDDDDKVPELEEEAEEEIPELEEMPTIEGGVNAANTATNTDSNSSSAVAPIPRIQNRAEKKARKVMLEKHSMKVVTGIARVTLKTTQGVFTILAPDVYVTTTNKNTSNSTYVVFGEAKQQGSSGSTTSQASAAAARAAQQVVSSNIPPPAPATMTPTITDIDDDVDTTSPAAADGTTTTADTAVDETGIDGKDIELVMQQSGCSRSKAVTALRDNDNDIVNAIMACSV